ncbi:uncharacterized protein [Phyllobates terribilis]|uniref:uncharacterized protein n=1 Tax=Phyllobates terribilis TaxID=111132 RepID=UPI003CCAF570
MSGRVRCGGGLRLFPAVLRVLVAFYGKKKSGKNSETIDAAESIKSRNFPIQSGKKKLNRPQRCLICSYCDVSTGRRLVIHYPRLTGDVLLHPEAENQIAIIFLTIIVSSLITLYHLPALIHCNKPPAVWAGLRKSPLTQRRKDPSNQSVGVLRPVLVSLSDHEEEKSPTFPPPPLPPPPVAATSPTAATFTPPLPLPHLPAAATFTCLCHPPPASATSPAAATFTCLCHLPRRCHLHLSLLPPPVTATFTTTATFTPLLPPPLLPPSPVSATSPAAVTFTCRCHLHLPLPPPSVAAASTCSPVLPNNMSSAPVTNVLEKDYLLKWRGKCTIYQKTLMLMLLDDADPTLNEDLGEESEIDSHDEVEECEVDSETEQDGDSDEDEDVESYYMGKDKKNQWNKKPLQKKRREPQNIITHLPAVIGTASNAKTAVECWNSLFTDDILDSIVTYTNQYIDIIKDKFICNRTIKATDEIELRAFFGLLYLAGAYRANRQSLEELWSKDGNGVEKFGLVMSINRFKLLIRCLRFDDRTTRTERKTHDRLAPIRDIFQKFVENCKKKLLPWGESHY